MELNLKKMITNVSPIERNREALKTNPDFYTAQFQLKNRIKGSDLNQYFELTHSEIIGI